MLSEDKAKKALRIIVPIMIAAFSIFVLAARVPNTKFATNSLASIEDSKTTVMEFAGVTLATSLAISALPDDFASPYANTLAGLDEYFVFILIVLLLERLMVVEGVKVAFLFVIPIACGLYILGTLVGKEILRTFAYKLAVLGVACIFVVPVSTQLVNVIGSDYLVYVDETISEASAGADKINEANAGNADASILDRLSNALETALQGVNDLLDYFGNVIKKCINSIAIMVVTTFIVPLLTLFFFRWLLKELFSLNLQFATPKPVKIVEDKVRKGMTLASKPEGAKEEGSKGKASAGKLGSAKGEAHEEKASAGKLGSAKGEAHEKTAPTDKSAAVEKGEGGKAE